MTEGAAETLGLTSPAPSSPADAAAQADKLIADPAWRDRYLAGNGPEVAQLNALLAAKVAGGDQLDQIIAGVAKAPELEVVTDGGLSIAKQLDAAADFRALGISPEAQRQLFEGKPVSRAEYDAVVRLKADLLSQKDWVGRYLAGGRAEHRVMTLCNIVIVGGFEEKAT